MEWKYGIEFVHVDAVSLSVHIYPIGKDLSLYYLKNHYSLTFQTSILSHSKIGRNSIWGHWDLQELNQNRIQAT